MSSRRRQEADKVRWSIPMLRPHIEPLNIPLSLPSPRVFHSTSQITRGEG